MPTRRKPPRGRPTSIELERRKARVLDVASELLMKNGYGGTSIAEIAKVARVSYRMIIAHFGDKTGIYTQVVNQRSISAFRIAEAAQTASTLEGILFGIAKSAWTAMYDPQAIRSHRLLVAEGERFVEQTSEIARKSSEEFYNVIEKDFADLYDRKMIQRNDPKKSAKYFVDLINGLALSQASVGYMDPIPDDDEIREKIDLFIKGWLNPSSASPPRKPSARAKPRRTRARAIKPG